MSMINTEVPIGEKPEMYESTPACMTAAHRKILEQIPSFVVFVNACEIARSLYRRYTTIVNPVSFDDTLVSIIPFTNQIWCSIAVVFVVLNFTNFMHIGLTDTENIPPV